MQNISVLVMSVSKNMFSYRGDTETKM